MARIWDKYAEVIDKLVTENSHYKPKKNLNPKINDYLVVALPLCNGEQQSKTIIDGRQFIRANYSCCIRIAAYVHIYLYNW